MLLNKGASSQRPSTECLLLICGKISLEVQISLSRNFYNIFILLKFKSIDYGLMICMSLWVFFFFFCKEEKGLVIKVNGLNVLLV